MNFHPNRGLQQSEDSHDDVITVGEVNLQAEKNSDDAMGFFSNKKISWELKGYIFFFMPPSPSNKGFKSGDIIFIDACFKRDPFRYGRLATFMGETMWPWEVVSTLKFPWKKSGWSPPT